MPLSKQQISSPIEAGRSILDAHNIPSKVASVLEYASKRLARKRLQLTLVVVKNEYQLPTTPPCTTPISSTQTPEHSASGFASPSYFKSPVAGLRQLVRRGTGSSLASTDSSTSTSSTLASETCSGRRTSPTFPPPKTEAPASPRRWVLPLGSGTPLPSTPMTPHTPSSVATMTTATSSSSSTSRSQSLESFWARLVYASPTSPKDDKVIRMIMDKAERKFHIRPGGLGPITTASACGLNDDLIRRSIRQNEVLFSSDGLTLLGLDRLYSFKAALTAYAKSIGTSNSRIHTPLSSPGLSNHPVNPMPPTPTSAMGDSLRLEDAVDSLRRLVLSNGDRPVLKAELYRSFDWMGVNSIALADVERLYKRAYGGPEQRGPFEIPSIVEDEEREQTPGTEPKRKGFVKLGTPPPPKKQVTPGLKVNTNICTRVHLVRPKPRAAARRLVPDCEIKLARESRVEGDDDGDGIEIRIDASQIITDQSYEDDDSTTQPITLRDGPVPRSLLWFSNNSFATSIDEMLSHSDGRQSEDGGPVTPNGYDDISPTTRGEWGFLFKGDAWTQPRTAVVETC
ncbi:hypothetical protein F4861DRAFT_538141 [Xylaria intraflava]|nr:hypothetical protein F4861DRAFT_538141 [Xylaria intraflava]